MSADGSFSQIDPEFVSTNLRGDLLHSLDSDLDYRVAFVEETIRSGLAAQIRTIRERLPHPDGLERPMTQAEFGKMLGKSQSWVARLEDPNEAIPTVPTLLTIAHKFDIGLKVAFISFAELLDDITTVTADALYVPSFRQDRGLFPRIGPISERAGMQAGALQYRNVSSSGGLAIQEMNLQEHVSPKSRIVRSAPEGGTMTRLIVETPASATALPR
jgi:transcriptional regulator with XRE-family HTH domain